jgi:signal transduction histidine kinase
VARRAALATDNAQLYRAAQGAIELRDRFIAVASHELRNPLAVVNGHWELLGRRLGRISHLLPTDDLEKVDLSMVRLGQGIDQLRRLVEELLDVGRMTSGGIELRPTEIDLVAVIRQAVDEIPDADAARRLSLDVPPEPIVGSWDRGRLEQVVANLLANALKYSPPEAPVQVKVENLGPLVRLCVTDAGIGIPPEDLEAVFEPFTRARNAEAHHYPGLGLGLAVSREIVVVHGGRMWAESEGEGRGSTFIVELDRRMT